MIEYCIRIEKAQELEFKNILGISRIYLGNETCPGRFPTKAEITKITKIAKFKELKITILTPLITNNYFDSICKTIKTLPATTEIVINDMGLFNALKDTHHNLILGRLLIPIKKDIRMDITNDYNRLTFFNPDFFNFYLELGFNRFEIDNVQYSYFDTKHESDEFIFSVYLPEIITNIQTNHCNKCKTSIICPHKEKEITNIIYKDDHKEVYPYEIFCKRNYIFYRNYVVNKTLKNNINRIIITNIYELDKIIFK
ncbi:MAG TPA: hypothetical protein PLW77_05350 [Bacteroidales bacterium]|nr:hypothetical protein [Bacteroidales bacterium]